MTGELAAFMVFVAIMLLVGWHPTDKRGKSLSVSCTAEYTGAADCSRIRG